MAMVKSIVDRWRAPINGCRHIVNLYKVLCHYIGAIDTSVNLSEGHDIDKCITTLLGLARKNRTCLDNPVILSVRSYYMTD